jgi:DNA-binding FrmR family transcriptional regulator
VEIQSAEVRERLINRLRRIEGQVRGIQNMIGQDRDCTDIIQQLAAVRSAVQQTGLEVMRVYASQCLADPNSERSDEELLDYLVGALGRWT